MAEYKIFESVQAQMKPDCTEIVLRDEQAEAVKKAKSHFGSNPRGGEYMLADAQKQFLWNAKMRFGKTICAMQLVKEMGVKRVLIVTHRPVVNVGFHDDFEKIFGKNNPNWKYGSKSDKGNTDKGDFYALNTFSKQSKENHFVFFASMQYLRRSTLVGGDNDEQLKKDLLLTDWDLVVVDEAHEGTRTSLGQRVIDTLKKEKTKILHLSGTPFNLFGDFKDNEIYTWDYIQEQQAKKEFAEKHPLEYNPYAELPQMKIYTYSLDKLFDQFVEEGASFKFSEFFRTWTGNPKADKAKMPAGAKGRFVHEAEVNKFLDMLCDDSKDSNYPFSRATYQENFNHSLWIVPGVKEAKALEDLLHDHPVFHDFEVKNVAGNGLQGEEADDALDAVKNAIGAQPREKYTITISCGRLTTGVTVKEWTAVLYLKGSEMTSAATYMQTIFRVQSPWIDKEHGDMKSTCCVFDFAPDRTLKMVAETAKFSSMAKKKTSKKEKEDERETQEHRDKETMQAFIDLCPVISLDGGKMAEFDVNTIYKKLENVYIDRLVRSGFDDNCLYNPDELNKLDADMLNTIGKNGGEAPDETRKAASSDANVSQLTDEQRALIEEARRKRKENKQKHQEWWNSLSDEERAAIEAEREEKKRQREEFKKRVSNIRGIALRIPLLMYGGADAGDPKDDLTVDNFTRKIKDESWAEFMPKGISKEDFNKIRKCFNATRFEEAGKKYRALTREADFMHVDERIHQIVEIFSYFHNPDKETVLTPWPVVNMHMSDTIGGWCWYDETFDKKTGQLDTPRYVDQNKVTRKLFDNVDLAGEVQTKILEINSKTGLYPLYVTYSLYRRRLEEYVKAECIDPATISVQEEQVVWDDIVSDNMYVICNTPMAVGITRRTLFGFRNVDRKANIKAVALVDRTQRDQESLIKELKSGGFWKSNTSKQMIEFSAVVGNPPYMLKNEATSDTPIYHHFMQAGFKLSAIATFITPGRFLFDAGKTPKEFNESVLNDEHFKVIKFSHNSTDFFDNVDIKGGVAITMRNANVNYGKIIRYTAFQELNSILNKVTNHKDFTSIDQIIYLQNKFNLKALYEDYPQYREIIGSGGKEKRLTTSIFNQLDVFTEEATQKDELKIIGLINNNRIYRYIPAKYIDTHDNTYKYKVILPASNGSGAIGEVLSTPIIGEPIIGYTQSFISIGCFETEKEASAVFKYVKSKFMRTMLGVLKVTQHNHTDVWKFVPLQDFTSTSDINWNQSISDIDRQLYAKYGLSDEEIAFIEKMIKPME